jgi:hypothetical protein
VHAIHLHPEPFSVDNNMLTPTFKLKRPQVHRARAPPSLPHASGCTRPRFLQPCGRALRRACMRVCVYMVQAKVRFQKEIDTMYGQLPNSA